MDLSELRRDGSLPQDFDEWSLAPRPEGHMQYSQKTGQPLSRKPSGQSCTDIGDVCQSGRMSGYL
jgi:hypothetical protein